MPPLSLTPDELLSTTRSVRKRLNLERPVERRVVEECLTLAQQAPCASNQQNWHFIVVTDEAKRAALADLFRRGREIYMKLPSSIYQRASTSGDRQIANGRVLQSIDYLAEHLHQVPVHVIPCIEGRTESQAVVMQSAKWGSIGPAVWSFMLAARSRGLGTCWTSNHLFFEEEAAQVLGIPYATVMQTALIPVAYTLGTDFKPASRAPLDTMVHWDEW
ncbi:MAG: nitroreductase family protein [Ktedonobacteraceae bacterium]|nr:nitroreductase family protein [Chloroflexota bacterium]